MQGDEFKRASDNLRETARKLAHTLPFPVPLSRERLEELGEDADEIATTTEKFERLLPSLIINIALFSLDWKTPETLVQSPFPARPRRNAVQGGAR